MTKLPKALQDKIEEIASSAAQPKMYQENSVHETYLRHQASLNELALHLWPLIEQMGEALELGNKQLECIGSNHIAFYCQCQRCKALIKYNKLKGEVK